MNNITIHKGAEIVNKFEFQNQGVIYLVMLNSIAIIEHHDHVNNKSCIYTYINGAVSSSS